MGRKHYSGKELLYRRQAEKQKGQLGENTIRKKMQDINKIKKSVEKARKEMREQKGKEKADGIHNGVGLSD